MKSLLSVETSRWRVLVVVVLASLVGSIAVVSPVREASAQTCGTPYWQFLFDPPTLVAPPETSDGNIWVSSSIDVSGLGGQSLEVSFSSDVDLSGADESLEGVTARMLFFARGPTTAQQYVVFEQVNLDVNSEGTTKATITLPLNVTAIVLNLIIEIENETTYTGDPLFLSVDALLVTGPPVPCAPEPDEDLFQQFLAVLIAVLRDILAR